MPEMAVVAHRGASALAPENTVAAFRAAIELGVDAIETDVRATRDGALVLAHDETLARRAGRSERVADLDGAALGAIVVGADADGAPLGIPTLDDALRLIAGRARILLDLKVPPGHEAAIVAAIRAAGAAEAVIVGTRALASLATFRALAPELPILAFGRKPDDVWAMAEAGADIVRLWSPWATDAALARARHLGKPAWVMVGRPGDGSVGETTAAEVAALRQRGVAGVILNDPRLALSAR